MGGNGNGQGREGKGKTLWIYSPRKNFLATPLRTWQVQHWGGWAQNPTRSRNQMDSALEPPYLNHWLNTGIRGVSWTPTWESGGGSRMVALRAGAPSGLFCLCRGPSTSGAPVTRRSSHWLECYNVMYDIVDDTVSYCYHMPASRRPQPQTGRADPQKAHTKKSNKRSDKNKKKR